MSTFGGIQQAASSLAASQYGLQIVSQNISNASTPGYTRQAADQAAIDNVGGVPRRYTTATDVGGVAITGTSRLNDPVIDARARAEHARSAQADTNAAQLSGIESIFPEPSDTGLAEQLSTFWSDWAKVANDPGSASSRTVLLQDGATVASTLNAMSTSLSDVATSTTQSLGSDIDAANAAATQLNSVNSQIAIGHATGTNVNSLLDQRDQLLDQLSSLVGGAATINPNGTASVQVGGQNLVVGAYGGTAGSVSTIAVDSTPAVSVGGTGVSLTGGSAAASVTTLTTTLPQVRAQLDSVATALANAVNGAQATGYDLSGAAGAAMFGTNDGSGTITAANIAVKLTDPGLIAASSTSGGNLDGGNALAASNLGGSAGSPDNVYSTLVGQVASSSRLAQQQQTTQDGITASVDTLRQSASGVNLDEEVTNMLTLQRTYQAASRVLTTMDSLLDTLINHTGA